MTLFLHGASTGEHFFGVGRGSADASGTTQEPRSRQPKVLPSPPCSIAKSTHNTRRSLCNMPINAGTGLDSKSGYHFRQVGGVIWRISIYVELPYRRHRYITHLGDYDKVPSG